MHESLPNRPGIVGRIPTILSLHVRQDKSSRADSIVLRFVQNHHREEISASHCWRRVVRRGLSEGRRGRTDMELRCASQRHGAGLTGENHFVMAPRHFWNTQ